jgi:hypothetical protein
VEAGETPSGGLGAELDRIGSAVDAGGTDLGRLGFWRLVALIKLDDELIERYAEQVGRIDQKAFRARVRIRLPVWVGNLIFAVELAVGAGAFVLAATRGTHNFTFTYHEVLAGLGLLVAAGTWDVGVHSPTHWLVGRAFGIRFTDYFLKAPTAPPGLKIDYASYLRASPEHRAWMHASGAIATKLVPFAVLAIALVTGIDAPVWAIAILWVLGIGQIVTDLVFSTKKSDWKKVRRELGVAHARQQVHQGA